MKKMSQRKHCAYKGCLSKQGPDNSSNITFFQFPRDEVRFKLWMKLSRCENKDSTAKYLCSKHFDQHKYISTNPRRQLLLASAVPYSYNSDNDENETEEDQIQDVTSQFEGEEFIIQDVDVTDFDETDCNYAESTINEIDYETSESVSKTYNYHNKKRKLSTTPKDYDESEQITRSLRPNEIAPEHNSLLKKNNYAERIVKKAEVLEAEEEILTNPDITTFIFKGEEYIQMPKNVYLQEKSELVNSIQYYKEILMNLKSQVDNIKF